MKEGDFEGLEEVLAAKKENSVGPAAVLAMQVQAFECLVTMDFVVAQLLVP